MLVPALVSGRDFFGSLVDVAILGVVVLLGFVSWLVTRWQVENQELRIETGLIRRSSQRYPLAQVQAIDVIEPGLGRIFGLAELRLRMGGDTGGNARLAYVPARRGAEPAVAAARAREGRRGRGAAAPATDERVLSTIPTGRLVGSILLTDYGLLTEALSIASS